VEDVPEGELGSGFYVPSVKSLEERDKIKPGNDGPWVLSENVAFQLTRLLAIKPMEKAQDLAFQTLQQMLTRRMTAPQAKALVQKHLEQAGVVTQKPVTQPIGAAVTEDQRASSQREEVEPITPDSTPVKQAIKGLTLPPMNKGQERLLKGLLTAIHWVIQAVWAVIKAVFQYFWTPFKDAVRDVAGYLQRFMKGVMVFAIVLLFIGAIGWVVWQKVILHKDLGLPTFHTSAPRAGSPMVPVQPSRVSGLVAQKQASQTEGRDLSVPIPKEGIGKAVVAEPVKAQPSFDKKAPVKHAHHPKPVKPAPKTEVAKATAPDIPDAYQNRVGMDKGFALGFARTFYGTSYKDPITWMDYFKEWVNESYYNDFYAAYFPQSRIAEMNDKKLTQSFWSNKPAQFIKADEMTDEFIIQGVVTTTSDKVYHGEVMSKKTVSLDIILMHAPGTKGLVYKLKEITLEGK